MLDVLPPHKMMGILGKSVDADSFFGGLKTVEGIRKP